MLINTVDLPHRSYEKVKDDPAQDTPEAHLPVRLVVCVDGTWGGPDGIHDAHEGNTSNVFRIWMAVKEGVVQDKHGKLWRQQKRYFKGIDDTSNWISHLRSGAFATGIDDQIKAVYHYCCHYAKCDHDEIYFFGFSRGAFVVRAVANMLMHLRVLDTRGDLDDTFEDMYKQAIAIYKDIRQGQITSSGQIYEYMSKTKAPPTIQFIGVLDCVKAYEDKDLYDISLIPSLRHCRQALAMNETKVAFRPELFVSSDEDDCYRKQNSDSHSLLQAWFLGTHGDIGGSCAKDGLSLYPLQWLLSESSDTGLVLGSTHLTRTTTIMREEVAVDDPLELVFPRDLDASNGSLANPHEIRTGNGITVKLWDIRHVHKRSCYNLHINQRRVSRWVFSISERVIFDQGQLIGYQPEAPIGVFLHPSAYLVYDIDLHISTNSASWTFQQAFCSVRPQTIPDERIIFWKHHLGEEDPHVKRVRILVCGNAGVGKSSLIEKLLGIPGVTDISHKGHGIHDVNQEYAPEGAAYAIHDSCGFQAGEPTEVQKIRTFLLNRSEKSSLTERLHAILYCVQTNRLRPTERADEEFFQALLECDSNVPVIIVGTRTDELRVLCADKVKKDYFKVHGLKKDRDLSDEDWDSIEQQTENAVRQKNESLAIAFADLNRPFVGPVFVSQDDSQSLQELQEEVSASITHERVRNLFIAAQICSVAPKIKFSLDNSIRLYKHAVRTSSIPVALTATIATTTVTAIIVNQILKAFQYNGMSMNLMIRTVSNALIRNYEANGIQLAGQALTCIGAGAMTTVAAAPAAIAFFAGAAVVNIVAIPQFARLLLMCTVDTILIMERLFWECDGEAPTAAQLDDTCETYREKMDQVHQDVKGLLPVWGIWNAYSYEWLHKEMGSIVEKHRFRRSAQ